MKTKIWTVGRRILSLILAICIVLSGELSMVVTAVDTTLPEEPAVPSADLADTTHKDYAIPTDQKHAYDPFAQMETQEETEAYRKSAQYEAGTVIFKLSQTSNIFTGTDHVAENSALESVGIDLDSLTQLNRRKVEDGFFTDTYEVVYQADLTGDIWDAIDTLAETEGVLAAQPNYLYEDTSVGVPTIADNPGMDQHWHHDQLNNHNNWKSMYDKGVVAGDGAIVAVIDTGVDYTHPDLIANMWVNTKELNGTAGVDDDGNGYVDDIHGVSTVGASRYHSGDPMDDHGHGTHVAGIIGMTANNKEGGVGVAYGAKIMAIKAGQATGIFSDTDIADAINYAVAMGADVINMSFGGTGRSFLVEEALADAFGSCVLVAAAGNEGIPTTDAPADFLKKADLYPAGYSYVLGVMATDPSGKLATFSNWDYYNNGGSAEYELTAPGVDIFSTLPNGQYAYWDGTSMAAPVVAAAAAVIRSNYPDKSVYSSRFIMGQLASATEDTTVYVDKILTPHTYAALNIADSVNKLPTPNVTIQNIYLFDDPAIDPANDGDGIVDAGETIDLGLVLRNQWGMASDVTVTVHAISDGGVANPNIEWITDTISMENVGTFNEQTNSFVYENDALTGTENPIRFKVKSDCINDAHIGFHIAVTCRNGMDPDDHTLYTFDPMDFELTFYVQRGRTLSGRITENMTLTKEDYWIIENSVYIPEGVTVTVAPGTQIQFWGSDASDPYADQTMAYIQVDGEFYVNGTEEEPVEMFPSMAFSNYGVDIRSGVNSSSYAVHTDAVAPGATRLSYVNILNPLLNFVEGDHLYAVQNSSSINYRSLYSGLIRDFLSGARVVANRVRDSRFANLRFELNLLSGVYSNCAFNGCSDLNFSAIIHAYHFTGCTISGVNSFSGKGLQLPDYGLQYATSEPTVSAVYTHGQSKYVLVHNSCDSRIQMQPQGSGEYDFSCEFQLRTYAKLMEAAGGTPAIIQTEEEKTFLAELLFSEGMSPGENAALGGYVLPKSSVIHWLDGTLQDRDYYDGDYDRCQALCYTTSGNKRTPAFRLEADIDEILLEFPATVADAEILAAVAFTNTELAKAAAACEEYAKFPVNLGNNAFLNSFYRTDTSTWNRIITTRNMHHAIPAMGNYFGTDDPKLVQAHILDADTYASLADIVTDPYLTLESPELETIYPFVTEAYITDMEGNRIESCGYQQIQLHVAFNRDMDQTVNPMVSYGPAEPYTDYVVDGEWVSPREWVATTHVKPIIDAGMEYIRVKDAVAADDAWLATGTDEARFAFTITNTGAAAMTMQAVGEENQVVLNWYQDDYDTLAGFNVYRSTSADGTFTKLNDRLIPGTIREYIDTDVEPGVEYFYYFTVMGTDLVESKPSNTASASPKDNIKPVLTHTRVTQANFGESISFVATATDNIGLEYVRLFYRTAGQNAWKTVDMINTEEDRFYATVGANEVAAEGVEYYIEVSDGVSVVRNGSSQYPNRIAVDSSIVIYSVTPSRVDISTVAEGITATVTGVNFTENMTVTVGGKAVEHTLISRNQLTFTIPEGNLGRADIVITKDGAKAQLTNAIAYTDNASEVQIIGPSEAKSGEEVKLPIIVTARGDLFAIDLQLQLDRGLYRSVSFEKNETCAAAIVNCSVSGSGLVKISVACATAIPTEEPIGYLVLKPASSITEVTYTDITVVSALINAVSVKTLVDCNMVIKPNFTISGRVTYYNGGAGIAGVTIRLSTGDVATTDENGNYVFTGITTNQVVVIPEFSGNVNGALSAQDASLVLQAITDENASLTDMQFIAADVDGDGKLTAMDSAYILQKNVGIIEGNFPGSGAEWAFSESSKSLVLTADISNVNFSGILLGDVTGDWTSQPQEELE